MKSKRIEIAQLDEQINGMLQKGKILLTQVSVDEVTVLRDKKICMVCRGEVLGFTYICECDTIYCENCARALTNLENACWACNNPIDKLKPIKPYNKEEDIDLESQKKLQEISKKDKKLP